MDEPAEIPKKTGRGGLRWVLWGLVAFALIGTLIAGGGYLYLKQQMTVAGPETVDGDPRLVEIPRGASVAAMGGRLYSVGAIESVDLFKIAVRLTGAETGLKAGEFEVPSGASLEDVIEVLTVGKGVQHAVTIPEGLTSEAVVNHLNATSILSGKLLGDPPLEGALLADTYMVHRGEARTELLGRMRDEMNSFIDEAWKKRQRGLPYRTKRDALILASIVEKETALAEERPRVAAVFINRLRRKMRLQTDPTIIYGVCKFHPERCRNGRLIDKDGNQRGIRRSEIQLDTGFNTYRIDGLPPTPICNPGKDAILAVLDPPKTADLFFVADGSGGHAFATNYEDHQKNVAKWRRIERNRKAGK